MIAAAVVEHLGRMPFSVDRKLSFDDIDNPRNAMMMIQGGPNRVSKQTNLLYESIRKVIDDE